MTTCHHLALFCDGELAPVDAFAFRHHLRRCNPCQVSVLQHFQLCARLSELRPMIETGPVLLAEETP